MRSCRLIVISIIFIFTAANANAQKVKHITLNEAINLSLQSSKQLKFSQAKIEEANAILKQAKDNRLPDINITSAYLRVNNFRLNLKGSSPQNPTTQILNSFTETRINQVSYALATANLPLFSGFSIRNKIESARCLAEAAKMDESNDREAMIENTIEAYSNLYKTLAGIDLIKDDLLQAEKRVQDFVSLEKNGMVVRNDILRTELQKSNIELSLFEAQSNLKTTTVNLNLMLGLEEDTELIPDTSWLHYPASVENIAYWEQMALQNRKDYNAMHLRLKSADFNLKVAKGLYYPGVSLMGNYIAVNIPHFLSITNLFGIGVGLKYNIGSLWKTEAKVAQERARQRQLMINEDVINDQIIIQINEAYQSYLLSLKKVEVFAKSVEQAIENYKITHSKFDNKTINTTDLLDADYLQLQAKLDYAFSKADAMVAYKKLLFTAGILTN